MLFVWGQTLVKVMKIMVTPSKDPMHVLLQSAPPTLQQATTDPGLHRRIPTTHRQVRESLLGVTDPFTWVLVHRFLLCPPSLFPSPVEVLAALWWG